jgi:hypothetical protein
VDEVEQAVSKQHVKAIRREEKSWNVFDKRYWPGQSFGDRLGFALRHEDSTCSSAVKQIKAGTEEQPWLLLGPRVWLNC